MIVERLPQCCKVAETGWNGASSPEKLVSRARLYVVPDVRFAVVMIRSRWRSIIFTSRSSAANPARARWPPPPTARPRGCATIGLSAATTSPTSAASSIPRSCCRRVRPNNCATAERLWNDVEAFEARKDAQLAREVEFALPREMTPAQGIELARDFVQSEFVDQGMIADLNVHWDMAEDGDAQAPRPCDADDAIRGRGRLRSEGAGLEPHRDGRALARTLGRSWPTSGWLNSTSTRASTIAAWRHRASRWSHKARSARPRSGSRAKGSRPPTARKCTARSRATTAHGSSPILRWRSTRSPTSNRPSRGATWRCSRTGTAAESSSSTQSWARCGARPSWSNSARTDAARTALPPAR